MPDRHSTDSSSPESPLRTPLANACSHRPFSNGTEGDAWMYHWCEFCVHDHDISHPGGTLTRGCGLILNAMMPDFPCDEFPWPEAWLPEPDDGSFALPSRMVCGQFSACTEDDCTGDPGAAERAERVIEVTDYWRSRAANGSEAVHAGAHDVPTEQVGQ